MKDTALFNRTAPARRSAGLLAGLLRRMGERITYGSLVVSTPGGETYDFGSGTPHEPCAVWRLKHWSALWTLFTRGATGLAESYLDGRWDSPDLTTLLEVPPSMNLISARAHRARHYCCGAIDCATAGDRIRHARRGATLPITTISATPSMHSGWTRP